MFRSHYSPKIFAAFLFPIVLLALSSSTNAQNRFAVRVTSFPNTVMFGDLRIINGKPQASFLQRNSCLGSTCSSKFNLAGDLGILNGQIKDIAINNVIQSSTPKISGVCSNLIDQNGVLAVQSQRSFNFPSSARHTGIASVIAYQGLNNKPQIAFFKQTENSTQIAHVAANFNSTNCNVTGPFVEFYRIVDSEYQTSWKSNSEYVGVITKNAEGFEFYYANVLVPGNVGETELNVPGGSAVNVVSAYLAVGPTAVSPGIAGIPNNRAFLLYRIHRQQGNAIQSSIVLQQMQLQGNSFATTGTPKTVAPFTTTGTAGAENVHSVALGPNGDFAIFSAFSTACQKEILRFQRLNANTGAKIGASVALIDCAAFSSSIFGAYAVDLLPLTN